MSAGLVKGRLLGTKSPSEVFQVIDSKERGKVVTVVNQEDVSLGMVDPVTGRWKVIIIEQVVCFLCG